MLRIWNLFNGNKTNIAAGILVLSVFCSEVLVGIWGIDDPWMNNLVRTLDWIGMILGGTGLTHKSLKALK